MIKTKSQHLRPGGDDAVFNPDKLVGAARACRLTPGLIFGISKLWTSIVMLADTVEAGFRVLR